MNDEQQPVGSFRTSPRTSLLVTAQRPTQRRGVYVELQSFVGADGQGWCVGRQRVVIGVEHVEALVWLLQEAQRLLTCGRPLWSEPARDLPMELRTNAGAVQSREE